MTDQPNFFNQHLRGYQPDTVRYFPGPSQQELDAREYHEASLTVLRDSAAAVQRSADLAQAAEDRASAAQGRADEAEARATRVEWREKWVHIPLTAASLIAAVVSIVVAVNAA